MRAGMIAHDARAPLGMGLFGDAVADPQRVFGRNAVPHQPCDRVVSAADFGDDLRAGRIVERASISHLPAGFGVDDGAVEDDFAGFARLQFGDGSILRNDRPDARVLRAGGKVKVRLRLMRLRNLRVSRIRRLFARAALPGSPRPSALLLHRPLETTFVKCQAGIACGVLNKIAGQAVSIIEPKGVFSRVDEIGARSDGTVNTRSKFIYLNRSRRTRG